MIRTLKDIYFTEVAEYINNKFGDDYTLTEPYPEEKEPETTTNNYYRAWYDETDEWLMPMDNYDDEKNIVGYLK